MSNKKNYFVIGLIFVIFLSVSLVSGFSFSDLKFFFTGRVVSNTCNENSFTTVNVWQQGDATLDNIAYAVKDLNSDFVALFKNTGDLYLKGICVSNPNCNPPSSSFVVKNNLGAVVSYIDPNGNLCVESGDCSDKSASCNPTSGGFLIKDLSGNNRAYIDSSGDLCLIGNLNTESKIAKEVLLKILEQTSYNNKILKIESITSNKDIIVSAGSCTTNCIAPIVKILNDNYKIEEAHFVTTHAYTSTQKLIDSHDKKDMRRGRSAPHNIIPSTSGASQSVVESIPELKGKLEGYALRVPVIDGSISSIFARVSRKATKEEINSLFKKCSLKEYKDILQYTEEQIVSSDIIHNKYSCIFDATITNVTGNLISVAGWYDNEWGYSNRLVDVVKLMIQK